MRFLVITCQKGPAEGFTCSPLRPSCFTATSSFLDESSMLLIVPQYTHPNPPSPIMTERLKFLVADLSSETVNSLRLLGFCGMIEKLPLPVDDSMLVSDTFRELKSDSLLFISPSADDEVAVWAHDHLGVLAGSLLSPLRNKKHFIACNENTEHQNGNISTAKDGLNKILNIITASHVKFFPTYCFCRGRK